MTHDVKGAYFNAPIQGEVFVEIPQEDLTAEDRAADVVGRLRLSLYGTREAAGNWQRHLSAHLISIGFTPGSYSPCTYFHSERGVSVLVHGDDYCSTGRRRDLLWLKGELEKKYELKTSLLGTGVGAVREGMVLNRIIR